ncbi:hypothetical protein DVA76_19215, partial [Acinetobacter baumannii]
HNGLISLSQIVMGLESSISTILKNFWNSKFEKLILRPIKIPNQCNGWQGYILTDGWWTPTFL